MKQLIVISLVCQMSPWLALAAQSAAPIGHCRAPCGKVQYLTDRRLAVRLFEAGALDSAAAVLNRLSRATQDEGEIPLLHGRVLAAMGRHDQAIRPLQLALERGAVDLPEGELLVAAAFAQARQQDSALHWLERSVNDGLRGRSSLIRDPRFEGIRTHARFLEIAGAAPRELGRDSEWQYDLDFLVREVTRLHYRYRDIDLPVEFQEVRRRIASEIPNWTDERIAFEMQRMLATLGDGHTLAYPFAMRRGSPLRIGVSLYWFADGLYVTGAADTALVGGRVMTFGGMPTDEVMARARLYLSTDNDWGTRWVSPLYLTFTDLLVSIGAASTRSNIRLGLLRDGEVREYQVTADPVDPETLALKLGPPMGAPAPPIYLQHSEEPHWFGFLADSAVAYAQLNQVADGADESFEQFANRTNESLGRPGLRAFVIDLRLNNGGDAGLLPPFVRAVAAFRMSRPEVPIYVIIGRNTFSAAQSLVNLLEQLVDPTFVGEPPGTRPNRFGNEATFRLPYSGVIGTISSGYNQGATSRDRRQWVSPQLPIPLTSTDYWSGRDPALAAILELHQLDGP